MAGSRRTSGKRSNQRRAWSPWTHLVLAIIVVVALQAFVVKLYQVPSASMEQTYLPGDRILVDRTGLISDSFSAGDTIVFVSPSWDAPRDDGFFATTIRRIGDFVGFGPSTNSARLKRIVAGPGQSVSCCDSSGQILVDGASVYEPYVWNNFPFTSETLDCSTQPRSTRCFNEFNVPAGQYVVLGDNRANSADSVSECRDEAVDVNACVRTVGSSEIIGNPVVRLWPLGRFGSTSQD